MRGAIAAFAGLLALAGMPGALAAQTGADVLARVGEGSITRSYLLQAEQMQGRPGQGQTQADRELLLRHLAERKLVALVARDRWDAEEGGSVGRDVALDESGYLAETFHDKQVVAATKRVTEQELAAAYRPAMRYDVTRFQFADAGAAGQFVSAGGAGWTADSKELAGVLAGSDDLPEELAAALAGLKPGALSAPVHRGRSFWVLRLNAAHAPSSQEQAAARETLRLELDSGRAVARRDEVLGELKKKYTFKEQPALVEALRSRKEAGALPADRELAGYDGGAITAGEFSRALVAHEKKAMHGVMSVNTLGRVYRQMVEHTLFERAARQAGADRGPEFEAYRELMTDLRWAAVFAGRIRRDAAASASAEAVKSYYDGHRAQYPGAYETEQAAVQRQLVMVATAAATTDALAKGREKYPISYTAAR